MKLHINDTFTAELPADPIEENRPRQVSGACFSYVEPTKTTAPKLITASKEMAELLGISAEDIESEAFTHIFSGNALLEGSRPYAMCYGGHQFGHWAGQLGDGRAINLAQVEHADRSWTLQLKGAGVTPYSRTADGLAVLRSSIREYLCSEAMYHLGVPTTRALSLALTGDEVLRDVMYDGNPAYEKGAVVCRVAPSFIRFGNFEIFAARKDHENLRKLADYTIRHYFPGLGAPSKATYLDFLREVARRTKDMIIDWQRVGFVHGVMNTDNMSILGLTIDYGPYGWLEDYDPNWTPNTTDRQQKRYRFGHQGAIGLWNMVRLANALYPLIEDVPAMEEILHEYQRAFGRDYVIMTCHKLGLEKPFAEAGSFVQNFEKVMQLTETDMTIFFRNLSAFSMETDVHGAEGTDFMAVVHDAFYHPDELQGTVLEQWRAWFSAYAEKLKAQNISDGDRAVQMDALNPKYVLRNYMAQLAIDAADAGDYSLIKTFETLLKNPYAEQSDMEKWFVKRPDWARSKVGCSMLSCSS